MRRSFWNTATFVLLLQAHLGCQVIVGIEDRKSAEEVGDGDSGDGDDGDGDSGDGDKGDGDVGDGDSGDGDKGDGDVGDGDTGDGDMGDGDAGDGDMEDAAEPMPTACETYCETVMANCTGEFAVYADTGLCLEVCKILDDTLPVDDENNTIACRTAQAEDAKLTGEPKAHCFRAGPGGGGVCGQDCVSYCTLFENVCSELAKDDCLETCPALRNLTDEKNLPSQFDVKAHHDGDYLQCRLVHASSAAVAPDTHCWHADFKPAPQDGEHNPCNTDANQVPRCEDYCRLNLAACAGDEAVYEDVDQCMATCATIPPGTPDDQGKQDTRGCRITHSYNAFVSAADHCSHAGPGGDGVCGENCPSYCRTAEKACMTEFATKYPGGTDECEQSCAALATGPKYRVNTAETSGNTLACRLLHATRAFGDGTLCGAALGDAAPCM